MGLHDPGARTGPAVRDECPACDGRGRILLRNAAKSSYPCDVCGGSGFVEDEPQLEPGVRDTETDTYHDLMDES